jgi:hypothetical protein
MKMKIISIFLTALIITSIIVVAQPPKTMMEKAMPSPIRPSVDVPVWEVDDQWVYKIDNITINVNKSGNDFYMYLQMDELPLTVTDVTPSSYLLDFETSVTGTSHVYADLGDGPIDATINLPKLTITGNIEVDKSTLGIQAITFNLNGRFWINIIDQPYLEFSLPVLPFKITSNVISDFTLPVSILTFPLNTSMMWNSTATNMTMNGEVRSPWFYLFQIINIIYPFLPPEIGSLLPVVNIQEAFTALGTNNTFGVPQIPGAFYCLTTEEVSLPGGTYDAYNISILYGKAQCYFAPDAGSIVKLTGNLQEIIPYIQNINMELMSTTYE